MNKKELENKVDKAILQTKEALQTVYDALNNGQKKQIIKNKSVLELFNRYGVELDA